MPIKDARFLLTRKGLLAMQILEIVNKYVKYPYSRETRIAEVAEVLDWIAGEVVKEAEDS